MHENYNYKLFKKVQQKNSLYIRVLLYFLRGLILKYFAIQTIQNLITYNAILVCEIAHAL